MSIEMNYRKKLLLIRVKLNKYLGKDVKVRLGCIHDQFLKAMNLGGYDADYDDLDEYLLGKKESLQSWPHWHRMRVRKLH